MNIRVKQNDDELTHLALEGRLDITNAQAIELQYLALTAARGKPTLVDMSGVPYIASMGIHMLLSSAQALKRKGARTLLINVQPLVRDTLTMAGLDELIAPTDDEADAVREVQKPVG